MFADPVILVDICNSIADVNSVLAKRGVDISRYPARVDFPLEEWLRVFWEAKPYPSAVEILNLAVQHGFEIFYVTSRPQEALFVTRRWLDVHKFPPGDLIIGIRPEEKVIVARELMPYLIIEDDPAIIHRYRQNNFPVVVKAQPYNRKYRKSNDGIVFYVEDFSRIEFAFI